MTWSFRLRFLLSDRQRITADRPDHEVVLQHAEVALVLRSLGRRDDGGGPSISESDELTLVGSGYASDEEATEAAATWQRQLTTALAANYIGANLGARSTQATLFTRHGQAWARQHFGIPADDPRPIVGDRLGVNVYETDTRPIFATSTARPIVTYLVERLDAALDALTAAGYVASRQEQFAYDMFAASFFLPSPDARFVTLVMAVEALIEQPPRSEQAQQLVADLIEETKQAGLAAEETQSLIGTMEWLKRESIGQGGRRLARRLAPRTYGGANPVAFFNRCYEIRSALVHGSENRPSVHEVNIRAAQLENFVADLLSGPLLDRPWLDSSPAREERTGD